MSWDVVIVGGGIGGGALSLTLSRAGVRVLVLERTLEYADVVRGEWIAPWGIPETRALDVYALYRANGGHHVTRHITYDEEVPPRIAERAAVDMTALIPDNPGPLCIGHPTMCNVLNDAARAVGVTVLRGVTNTSVVPGDPPSVTYQHDGATHTVRPRLVVGADGRHGKTAEQIGMRLQQDPPHHRFSGMLVDGVSDWPADTQFISTEGDVNVLAFPQGNGRIRLYLGFKLAEKTRLAGPQGPQRFLEAFRLKSVPGVDAIVAGRPIGPCLVYPNNDTWLDVPLADGVVLIGDAAGRNDPITGQGLSITHRDVRIVRDLLLGENAWTTDALMPYAEERQERMRRLRIAARISAAIEAEFDDAARARRRRVAERRKAMAPESLSVLTPFVGPDVLPADCYTDEAVAALLA
jgi:2-polyprenyl-6-methoxyphenol hydroxylase-like FAD-dependent oxidoreductase